MIQSVLKHLARIWFLGLIFLFFIVGYTLYSILWLFRLINMKKKLVLLAIFSAFLAVTVFSVYYLLFPLGDGKQKVEIIIARGSSVSEIADSLKKRHVITSVTALRVWLKLSGAERKIQAGKVTVFVGDGIIRASKSLQHAQSIETSFTVEEGLTIEQVAAKIINNFSIDTAEFIRLCHDTIFISELGFEGLKSLEGFLFPDTYRFPNGVKEKEIIRKMVKHFDEVYKSLTPDISVTSRYNKLQIITIASIVEKEATVPWERARISGVFHNRLKLGYPLGADPTVRYALKKFNGPLRVSELNSSSPYNTRRFSGLPPGPICSPGKASLQAAMAPAVTKDLYFVAKWDGSGEHDFSKTNEEHTRKKLMIRQQNETRKKKLGSQ